MMDFEGASNAYDLGWRYGVQDQTTPPELDFTTKEWDDYCKGYHAAMKAALESIKLRIRIEELVR